MKKEEKWGLIRKMKMMILIGISVIWGWKVKALIKLPPNLEIPAVIVLGDSIMDTGNNNNRLTLAKCNWLPYGVDFQGGISTGRCCNGNNPSDIIGN